MSRIGSTETGKAGTGEGRAQHVVWDRFVRVFHWSLALAVTVALVTGLLLDASWIRLHLVAGIAAAALVVARIVWGFAGPAYARFAQFLPGPAALRAHLRGAGEGGAGHGRHVGHNPLGALMVVALLAMVLALAVTGTVFLGGALKTGPLAAFLTAERAGIWGELHEALALLLLALVALHLGGVAFESRRGRESLVGAMVTGRKEARPGDITAAGRRARPLAAAVVTAALLGAGGAAAVALSARPPARPPLSPQAFPAVYEEECAACHMAYHPALRPARSWRALMAGLGDHFGEDATLPDDVRDEITAWLEAHAAGTVDSRPASLWRDLPADPSLALPDTPQWKALHEDVDPALFRLRRVYSRSNCAACHKDAETGWFSPFAISVPKETEK